MQKCFYIESSLSTTFTLEHKKGNKQKKHVAIYNHTVICFYYMYFEIYPYEEKKELKGIRLSIKASKQHKLRDAMQNLRR